MRSHAPLLPYADIFVFLLLEMYPNGIVRVQMHNCHPLIASRGSTFGHHHEGQASGASRLGLQVAKEDEMTGLFLAALPKILLVLQDYSMRHPQLVAQQGCRLLLLSGGDAAFRREAEALDVALDGPVSCRVLR